MCCCVSCGSRCDGLRRWWAFHDVHSPSGFELRQVRESRISGRGVFARAPIPVGTVLGAYPGRLRSAAEMVAKCQETPLAASYIFRTGGQRLEGEMRRAGEGRLQTAC